MSEIPESPGPEVATPASIRSRSFAGSQRGSVAASMRGSVAGSGYGASRRNTHRHSRASRSSFHIRVPGQGTRTDVFAESLQLSSTAKRSPPPEIPTSYVGCQRFLRGSNAAARAVCADVWSMYRYTGTLTSSVSLTQSGCRRPRLEQASRVQQACRWAQTTIGDQRCCHHHSWVVATQLVLDEGAPIAWARTLHSTSSSHRWCVCCAASSILWGADSVSLCCDVHAGKPAHAQPNRSSHQPAWGSHPEHNHPQTVRPSNHGSAVSARAEPKAAQQETPGSRNRQSLSHATGEAIPTVPRAYCSCWHGMSLLSLCDRVGLRLTWRGWVQSQHRTMARVLGVRYDRPKPKPAPAPGTPGAPPPAHPTIVHPIIAEPPSVAMQAMPAPSLLYVPRVRALAWRH